MTTERWTLPLIQAGVDYIVTRELEQGRSSDPEQVRSHVVGMLSWLLTTSDRYGYAPEMIDMLHSLLADSGYHDCTRPEPGPPGARWDCGECGSGFLAGELFGSVGWHQIYGPWADFHQQHP